MERRECETVLGSFSRHGTVLDMLREHETALDSAYKCDMDDMDTMFNLITVFLFDELEKSGFGNAVSIQIF